MRAETGVTGLSFELSGMDTMTRLDRILSMLMELEKEIGEKNRKHVVVNLIRKAKLQTKKTQRELTKQL